MSPNASGPFEAAGVASDVPSGWTAIEAYEAQLELLEQVAHELVEELELNLFAPDLFHSTSRPKSSLFGQCVRITAPLPC